MKKVYICSPYRPTGQNPEADEMWVIGTELSEGMKQELEYARKKNIPVTMKKV